ncbi:MAG: sugar ABC transporter substrate-binding protein [Gemmataceae bacterium]
MRSIQLALRRFLPIALATLTGCASFSNPTTFPAVPVRRLPDEMLGKARDEQLDIPQALLRQEKPDKHLVDAGDILGIVFPGVLGAADQAPPVSLPQPGQINQTIGIGYPIPVLDDGTITLPLLEETIDVRGLSVPDAQKKIKDVYVEKGIYRRGDRTLNQLIVTLYRARQFHVLVVRQDSGEVPLANNTYLSSKRGSGYVLDLPAYENDVLTALTRSGGLPGNDAKNEVIIQRGKLEGQLTTMPVPSAPIPGLETITIPLRLRPGEPIPFKPRDIILQNGDIVFIQSRDTEVFYTGGLITPGEYPIPRNYDLDVLTAVALTHGPLANGGLNYNNLSGNIVTQGLGSPSPSQLTVLRRAPGKRQITIRVDLNRAMQDPRERILIQPGDFLILQETMGEAFTRYMTTQFKYNVFTSILRTKDATITGSGTFP